MSAFQVDCRRPRRRPSYRISVYCSRYVNGRRRIGRSERFNPDRRAFNTNRNFLLRSRAAIENVTADSRERALDSPFLSVRLLFFSDLILDSDTEQIEEPSSDSNGSSRR